MVGGRERRGSDADVPQLAGDENGATGLGSDGDPHRPGGIRASHPKADYSSEQRARGVTSTGESERAAGRAVARGS